MNWTIPGTVLTAPREEGEGVAALFSSMFLPGGMVLSQVTGITGLEAYTVQNWVKRGFLSPPVRKRYSQGQVCRIITINMLKSVLPMERICGLLSYLNGELADESDDVIDDAALYFLFVRLACHMRDDWGKAEQDNRLEMVLADYKEPVPGARTRVEMVLRIMLTAWLAARLRQEAENMLDAL